MEEQSTAKKKQQQPLSLNQRFSRLRSASHSKPPPLYEENVQSKYKQLEDDVPHFSFADFDSSPDGTRLSEEKESVSEVIDDNIPNLPLDVTRLSEEKKSNAEVIDDNISKLPIDGTRLSKEKESVCEVIDENIPNSPDAKPKVEKVKIKGRRRLCKLSSKQDDDVDQGNEGNHQFFDVSDFGSPPTGKDVGCAGDAIRDILGDLSSRIESLTIEKKKNPREVPLEAVPLGDDSIEEVTGMSLSQKNDGADSEFGSVSSSFASFTTLSSSSSGVKGGVEDKEVESKTVSEFDGDKYTEEAKMIRNVDVGKPQNVSRKVKEEPAVSYRKSAHVLKDKIDSDEDDCVEVGGENWTRRGKCRDEHFREDGASSVVEVLDDDDDDRDHDDDANENLAKDDSVITLKGPRSTYKLPSKIGKMLYPHQREGLRWLWSLHCQGKGGILGDDMGLGKTMQIAGFLAGLYSSRLIKRTMIVAPKTLIPHWTKELTAVGLSYMIKDYYGTCPKLRQYELQYVIQDKGILLTTYDIVRFNAKLLCANDSYDEDSDDDPLWDYMILDEGHLIKNPSTQRAKSLLGIPCAHRIIISGTPIQNNLKELWALFNFCCPDLLGDHKEFRERYEHPILRGNDKRASERDKRVGSMTAKELRERIKPYFLRRLKSEVFGEESKENAKLSKKNEIIVWLRLTSCQRQLYEAFLKSEIVLSAFDGSPLAAITILKKICDHPYLLTKRAAEDVLEGMDSMLNQEDRGLAEKLAMHAAHLTEEDDLQEKHDNLSCKISFILSLLGKLIPEGHNVLIFSQTRKMLNLIQESLVTHGFEFLRIDGTTKASDRLKIVNEFQEGRGAPIFMLTSQVGGLGLTLTKADRVIVVDPAWNPSTDNQSVDRAYRIGQKKDVIVYRLMTCGTIEEKIYRMQIYKGGLFKTATEHKEQTRYFSQQDLKELFSLPKDGFDVSPTQLQLLAEHGDQISMSDFLKTHIKFLESLGIGGVSNHSLLYSKTEPTPVTQVEVVEPRRTGTTVHWKYGSSTTERYVDGAQYAFNPKNVNLQKMTSSPQCDIKTTESYIKDKINRLSQLLYNKATVSRLPDRGEKIRKQIIELNLELENLTTPERTAQIVDLDEISDSFQRSLHV